MAALARVAVGLFEANGFAATTVEEIAAAADTSASTFFRLFATKEDVVFFDLTDRLAALGASFEASSSPSAWDALHESLRRTATDWEADDPDFALARARLFHREPALRRRYLDICGDWEEAIAAFLAGERGVDPDGDIDAQLGAAALVGSFRAAFHAQLAHGGRLVDHVDRAIGVLEAGFGSRRLGSVAPLTQR
jgi:AcrR family transcriptional regulator